MKIVSLTTPQSLADARTVAARAAEGLRKALRLPRPWRASAATAGMGERPMHDVGCYAWAAVATVENGPEFAVWVDRTAPAKTRGTPPMLAAAMRFPDRPGMTAFLARRLGRSVSQQVRIYGARHRERDMAYDRMAIIEKDLNEEAVYVSRYWPSGALPPIGEVVAESVALFDHLETVVQVSGEAPPEGNIDEWDLANLATRPREEISFATSSVALRPAQARLRLELLRTWGRCSISGETAEQVLEAAHIVPFAANGRDDLHNALLLRADLHSLFDRYLIDVDPTSLTITCDERLESKGYRRFHGRSLGLPKGTDPLRYRSAFAERRLRRRAG
jgi:hypothetical protein